jgi:hypothetical protein
MKRSNLVIYLSLVFLSGLLVGALGDRLYCTRPVAASVSRPSPEEYRRQYVKTMNERLHLTPEQQQKLEQILDKTREYFHERKQQQTNEINAMLTPEQQAEYAQLRKEREERKKLEEQQRRQNSVK